MQPAAAEVERELARQGQGAPADAVARLDQHARDARVGKPPRRRNAGRAGANHRHIDVVHRFSPAPHMRNRRGAIKGSATFARQKPGKCRVIWSRLGEKFARTL